MDTRVEYLQGIFGKQSVSRMQRASWGRDAGLGVIRDPVYLINPRSWNSDSHMAGDKRKSLRKGL